jgi:coenzyme PQQ synthesis protein D (PqqD)
MRMSESTFPKARQDVVLQELDGELLVYDLEEHKAHCLNEMAALVWKRCDGTCAPETIARELGSEVDVVWLVLEELWKLGLLEGDAPERKGVSRRSLLKRAGVALAVPVAASIVVPTASAAVSCAGAGEPCLEGACCADSQCIQGTCFSRV